MPYDPFARGPHPVGVQSDLWTDAARSRSLPVEIWYPAAEGHRGRDLDPASQDSFQPGWVLSESADSAELARQAAVRGAGWAAGDQPYPLVLLVHGWAGHRRESTFIGTHLASHGYAVVSADHGGSTYADVDAFIASHSPQGKPAALSEHLRRIAEHRKADVPFLISKAISALPVRPDGVGITGPSYGGWTSLIGPAVDRRIAATVPMCPAGGDAPVGEAPAGGSADNVPKQELDLAWRRDVPTLMLVADRDSLLPLHGQLELLRAVPATTKRMVVLARSDHNHFVDDIDTGQEWLREFAQRMAGTFPDGPGDWLRIARSIAPISRLCPGDVARLAWRGLITSHFDAYLKNDRDADEFSAADIDATLAALGIDTYTIELASKARLTALDRPGPADE
jgi:dienelactone hydrolase